MNRRIFALMLGLLLLAGCSSRKSGGSSTAGDQPGKPTGIYVAAVTSNTQSYVGVIDAAKGTFTRVGSGDRNWYPVMTGDRKWILFLHENPDKTIEVHQIAPDGSGERLVPLDPGKYNSLAAQPGGSLVAITAGDQGMWLYDAAKRTVSQVLNVYARNPVFTPDGKSVLYTFNPGSGGIARVDVGGGTPAVLAKDSDTYALAWLGKDRFAATAPGGQVAIRTVAGQELGRVPGYTAVGGMTGKWLLVKGEIRYTLYDTANLSAPVQGAANMDMFPWGASPEGRYLLYSTGHPGGGNDLHVWDSTKPWEQSPQTLITVKQNLGIIGWGSDSTVLIRADGKAHFIDLATGKVTEIATISTDLTPLGWRPAPSTEQQADAAKQFYAKEAKSVQAIQKALGDAGFTQKTPAAIARDIDVPDLVIVEFPQQSVRVWRIGPYAEPTGGTLRWTHIWAQWWDQGQPIMWKEISGKGLTNWQVKPLGKDVIVVGTGYNMNDAAFSGEVGAWRLRPGVPASPATDLFAQVPAQFGYFKTQKTDSGVGLAPATGAGSKDGVSVQFNTGSSLDVKACTRDGKCSTLLWTDKGYIIDTH